MTKISFLTRRRWPMAGPRWMELDASRESFGIWTSLGVLGAARARREATLAKDEVRCQLCEQQGCERRTQQREWPILFIAL